MNKNVGQLESKIAFNDEINLVIHKDIELGGAYEKKENYAQAPIRSEANVELLENNKKNNQQVQDNLEIVNNNNIFESEPNNNNNKHSNGCMKFLEIIFYPHIKILMDFIFFTFASIACLAVGMIGFMFAILFFVYIILLFIPGTRTIGKKLLELCGIVLSFFFFKFIVIGLFFPWAVWMYIKTYIKICKNEINPDNTFKENFSVLTQDYYDYIGFFKNFMDNMQKVDESENNKAYEEVPKEGDR